MQKFQYLSNKCSREEHYVKFTTVMMGPFFNSHWGGGQRILILWLHEIWDPPPKNVYEICDPVNVLWRISDPPKMKNK